MNLFKNYIFYFFLLIFCYGEIDIKQSRDLERRTKDEVELLLGKVLERKKFIVSVSAEVDKKVVREVKEEEENSHTKEPILLPKKENEQKPPPPKEKSIEDEFKDLGFPAIEEESLESSEEEKKRQQSQANNQNQKIPEKVTTTGIYRTFEYRNQYEVLAVNVSIIFDQSIPIETRQSLQNLVSGTIATKYKEKGSVDFSVSDLKGKHPKKIMDYIQEYIVLFYIALGLIIFFIILMLVLFLMRVLLAAPRRREVKRRDYPNRPIVVRPKKVTEEKKDSLPEKNQQQLNDNFAEMKKLISAEISNSLKKKKKRKKRI